MEIVYDRSLPQAVFAAAELTKASKSASKPVPTVRLVIDTTLSAQSYALSASATEILVRGGDASGVMYGGLDIAEAIRTNALALLGKKETLHTPHIAQRGIKLNVPLDLRTPSYTDPSDAAQQNIPEIWSLAFWQELLDDMARHRYNVLSLWNLHPFPSIVKVPEFPEVALKDIWRTTAKLDDSFGFGGQDYVRPAMLAQHEVVKRLTIEEKITFWRTVMQHAKDRGIDFYWFTWNAFLHGAEGKEGLTGDMGSPRVIAYFRASVRETIKTYPLLAGIGITTGENMEGNLGGLSKENWLWKTYGEGIRDALKETPTRPFRLIHRFHQTGLTEIKAEFAELPCTLDLSFKYAVAHMYSVPDPGMIKPLLPLLSPTLRSWLTVRNDDIYSFRWADYDYAQAFIKAIPSADKIAGFYMGCDGFFWGRDFLTKITNPKSTRPTVMQKQWHSFALWGRLAYAPDLPAAAFERLTSAHFPGTDTPKLIAAWAAASKTFPLITRFFWGDIDLKWFPEACLSHPRHQGFYTVRHFMEGGTMPGAGVQNIIDWRNKKPSGVTPLQLAQLLQGNATRALQALPALQRTKPKNTIEYTATLGDIEAMAHLGLYYAAKIQGACALALFDKTGELAQQSSAVQHLEAALAHWTHYATAYTRQYVQPVLYNRVGWVDIPKLSEKVAEDIKLAHDWKPGTIDESKLKRPGTETGFKK
ncbi:carbohydrate-binding family 6 protein [Armatimonas sp.]|uniref:carbohydrate-binding family 6 protein n=1 Tax=Armatimonas sp. TaxID=1872638 RepID=UPI00374D2348